jgi:hypothetical protein
MSAPERVPDCIHRLEGFEPKPVARVGFRLSFPSFDQKFPNLASIVASKA